MIEFNATVEQVLFDAVEAAKYLLLSDGSNPKAAKAQMDRLVDQRKIKPAVIGNHRRYSKRELDRFIDEQTASHE